MRPVRPVCPVRPDRADRPDCAHDSEAEALHVGSAAVLISGGGPAGS